MKLTLRGSVYVADLRKLGGERVSLKTKDLAEAKRRYIEVVADLKLVGTVAKPPTVATLGAIRRTLLAGPDWGEAKDQSGLNRRWLVVAAFFGVDAPLSTITHRRMEEFVAWMREQVNASGDQRYSKKTIHYHLAILSKILRSGAMNGLLPGMPIVPWPKGPRKGGNVRWYTTEEEAKIIAWFLASDMPEMASLTEFLIDSGFRRTEAIGGYRVAANCAILDDQKSGEQSHTRLTTRAAAAASAKPWAGLTASQLNKRWVKMRDGLGLGSAANLHACRHTTATRLALAQVPLKRIQKFMRHASETVTLIYINIADDLGHSAADALERE